MRIPLSLLFIALLVWDFFTASPGQSAIERSYHALARSHVLQSFVQKAEAKTAALGFNPAALAKRSPQTGESGHARAEAEPALDSHAGTASVHGEADTCALPAPATDKARPCAAPQALVQKSRADAAAKISLASAGKSADADLQHSPLVVAAMAAGEQTSVSDGYLLHLALVEGGLQAQANASTSTAAGPFQFVDQTWLGMMAKYGGEYGLGKLAATIHEHHGVYYVADKEKRSEILALRKDPVVSSLMAARLTKDNAAVLRQALNREPLEGDLYVAHILGASDAVALIKTTSSDPERSAAKMFPDAAGANHALFYKPDGSSRSASELYAYLTRYPSPALLDLYRQRGYSDGLSAEAS